MVTLIPVQCIRKVYYLAQKIDYVVALNNIINYGYQIFIPSINK